MSRHCEIVVHSNAYDFLGLDFECVIELFIKKHNEIKKWAYILHDKDDGVPHYHVYLYFGINGPDYDTVARWFMVPSGFVNAIKGNIDNYLPYFVHYYQKYKYQCLPSEVVANFDFEGELSRIVLQNKG